MLSRFMHLFFKRIDDAVRLAYLPIMIVVLAEFTQHVGELQMGMYEDLSSFRVSQSSGPRLALGGLKALCFLTAIYLIPNSINKFLDPTGSLGPFRARFLKKLWNPSGAITGLIIMMIGVAPLIHLHFTLNKLAISSELALPILIVDSLVVGLIGLVVGLCIWVDEEMRLKLKV